MIGGILRDALQDKHEVYGLDQQGECSDRVLSADISEYEQVADVVEQLRPLHAIIHLAGDPSPQASWESVLNANIIGTRNIFEAAREFAVPRLIFASSNHAAGAYHGYDPESYTFTRPHPLKVSPYEPPRPDSEYGVSKVFGEAIARYYSDRWDLQAICLRIGAVLKDDNPTKDPQNRQIWLSHRDLIQLIEKTLTTDVKFGIYFGI